MNAPTFFFYPKINGYNWSWLIMRKKFVIICYWRTKKKKTKKGCHLKKRNFDVKIRGKKEKQKKSYKKCATIHFHECWYWMKWRFDRVSIKLYADLTCNRARNDNSESKSQNVARIHGLRLRWIVVIYVARSRMVFKSSLLSW